MSPREILGKLPLALGRQLQAVWWEMYGGCRIKSVGFPKSSKASRLRG